jgi:hypothetical protein
MKKAMNCRKRPCRIWRRWFSPDPRLKDRQMTCGDARKREWHGRKCAEWNRENSELIKTERLLYKLNAIAVENGQTKVREEAPPTCQNCEEECYHAVTKRHRSLSPSLLFSLANPGQPAFEPIAAALRENAVVL